MADDPIDPTTSGLRLRTRLGSFEVRGREVIFLTIAGAVVLGGIYFVSVSQGSQVAAQVAMMRTEHQDIVSGINRLICIQAIDQVDRADALRGGGDPCEYLLTGSRRRPPAELPPHDRRGVWRPDLSAGRSER